MRWIVKKIIKKHLANTVTISRIIGTVILLVCFTPYVTHEQKYLALWLFGLLALSDKLDGSIAKSRFGEVSDFGKMADPVADKILDLVYLALIKMHMIPIWPVALLYSRHYLVGVLRLKAISQQMDISARFSGKLKTAFSYLLVFFLLARGRPDTAAPTHDDAFLSTLFSLRPLVEAVESVPEAYCYVSFYVLALLTLYSCYDYLTPFMRLKKI